MKKVIELFAQLFAVLIFTISAFAQNTDENWMLVKNETGEFSIEIPKKHFYFFDKEGFEVSTDRKNYRWKNANFINAYAENTLVSIESYEAKKEGLDSPIEDDKKQGIFSEFKNQILTVKQTVIKKDEYYLVRQYFYLSKYIYILTTASRNGETPAMKRFLSSLKPNSDKKLQTDQSIPKFYDLKPTLLDLRVYKADEKKKDNSTITASNQDKDNKIRQKMIVLSKPQAAYLDQARMMNVQGEVELQLAFSANGSITKIIVLKSLPEGLTKQSVFAALRLKFLPALTNDVPVTTERSVIYNFSLY